MVGDGKGVGPAVVAAGYLKVAHERQIHAVVPGSERLHDAEVFCRAQHIVVKIGAIDDNEVRVGDGAFLFFERRVAANDLSRPAVGVETEDHFDDLIGQSGDEDYLGIRHTLPPHAADCYNSL